MSENLHGLLVLTAPLADLEVSRDQVVAAAAGATLLDETEGSLTLGFATADGLAAAVGALVGLGLIEGQHCFALSATVPDWLPAYQDASSNMVEHGG